MFVCIKKYFTSLFWFLIVLFFSYQMFSIIWPYTGFTWDIDFLLTKQHLKTIDYYRLAFYSHIFSSGIVLLCGAFLFSKHILKKWPKFHRLAGRTYVALLLLISAPSGLIMGFHANGGWSVQLSFLLLTPLWWWFTWKGLQSAMRKDFQTHRIWMIRSYALTFSAISLRVYQFLLGTFIVMEPEMQYLLVSWLSWLGNWGLVEIWMMGKKYKMAFSVFEFRNKLQWDTE